MSSGDDTFFPAFPFWTPNIFDGGEGWDTVIYTSMGGVNVNLENGTAIRFGGVTDTLISIENILGSAYSDNITGDSNPNLLIGFGGGDSLMGAGGADILDGGDDTDYLDGGTGDDQLFGGNDYDVLFGGDGSDILYGGLGNDFLSGDAGNDQLFGEGENDYMFGGEGADLIDGGEGMDFVLYMDSTEAVSINLTTAVSFGGFATGDILVSVENIIGSSYGDTLLGDANANIIEGDEGNDTLKGRDGNDNLSGGDGTDYLEGGNGDDLLSGGNGADTIKGGTGVDTYSYFSVLEGGDFIQDFRPLLGEKIDLRSIFQFVPAFVGSQALTDGYLRLEQNGLDTRVYLDVDGNVSAGAEVLFVTLQNLLSTDVSLSSFTLPANGSGTNTAPVAMDDTFTGVQDTNVTGNLLVSNGNGADSDLDGNALSVTAQTLSTAHGSVVISANGSFVYTPTTGYSGADSFNYTLTDGAGGSDTGAVSITLAPATGIYGTTGNDTITGTASNDVIYGLAGNDTLYGEVGNDTLYGDAGADTLKGRDGNDIMYGGADVDYLEGGNGDDTLYGGLGADTLKGSAGVDTFVFQSMSEAGDIIQDYNYSAVEKIDISDLLSLYDPLSAAITDFVQITQSGANSILSIDVDGGANGFVQLATLNATSGLTDEAALVSSGRLIVV